MAGVSAVHVKTTAHAPESLSLAQVWVGYLDAAATDSTVLYEKSAAYISGDKTSFNAAWT